MKIFDPGDIAFLIDRDIHESKKEAVVILDTDVSINLSHGDREWSYLVMDSIGRKFWVDEYDLKPMTAKVNLL